MEFEKYLVANRENLMKKWFSAVIETYPKDSSQFFKNNSDPFANPVGTTIRQCLDLLFTEIIKAGMNKTAVHHAMEPIIRIRAIQEFTPAKALSFIINIKQIIAEELKAKNQKREVDACLRVIESNVDDLMLIAFDIYSACKDKVYCLRINEEKQRVRQLLIKKDLIKEISDDDSKLGCL
jgi:hypothetical protein